EFAHTLRRLIAPFTYDLSCTELLCECDALGMSTQHDNLLSAQALRGGDAAQANGAVTEDGCRFPAAYPGADSRMVARTHHVRQREKRRHQRVISADQQREKRSVCLGDAQ